MKENLELIDVENLAPYVINFNSHTFDVIFRNIKNVDELLSKTNLNF
jgi:hypothetical protein